MTVGLLVLMLWMVGIAVLACAFAVQLWRELRRALWPDSGLQP